MSKTVKKDYLDPSLPVEKRVEDLLSRMTLEQKVSQVAHNALAVEPLDIPGYNYWNEALHGVALGGIATVFPQAIGLAATWNDALIFKMATAISDEARAKHHAFLREQIIDMFTGLTYWSPNINICRDPRWGRNQETYGECPFLTSRMGVAFVKGMQGDDPRYLKTLATPKHFAVHSGPDPQRHVFNACPSPRDLRETYLPAFKACVQEAQAGSVMSAYNRVNGEPCSGSKTLLIDILRKEWGFDGYVVSDCGALLDFFRTHRVVDTPEEAAAMGVKNGCDLCCGDTYGSLPRAVEQGLISEAEIDLAAKRTLTARFKLGMFDPPEMVPYASIPYEVNDCAVHRELARETARQSIVLLKNKDNLLPLKKNLKRIAVVGPNANSVDVLLGNYHGMPSTAVTAFEGIRNKVGPDTEVLWAKACVAHTGTPSCGFTEAETYARWAEVAIVVLGLDPSMEGEGGDAPNSASFGDRVDIELPDIQTKLLEAIHATGTPMVVVVMNGSAVALNWAEENAPAIVEAWYPGEEGGNALADVLFGDYNPAGRLPITFYKSIEQVPDYSDYNMEGRTYRFFRQEPLYPFGYGLSYTQFKYSDLRVTPSKAQMGQPVEVSVTVQNTGKTAGDEVVQLYITDVAASVPRPIRDLRGFQRIHLAPKEKKSVSFTLKQADLSLVDDTGKRLIEPGEFALSVGGGQAANRGITEGVNLLTGAFTVVGETISIEA